MAKSKNAKKGAGNAKGFLETLYVPQDKHVEDAGAFDAWPDLEDANSGIYGIYKLVETVQVRHGIEVKYKGGDWERAK